MLMSKSRLEKFLYALYSLDSSDLPTPLSRIEELYNCWVTGEEAPTFKPLSRVEKYLMAILGVYDVNELPNPISRVEVLLHKLAIGDDNLDDVKSFLSEHEELLAEIIRNGGIGGNIDIEYVSYTLSTGYNTLYNTAEKPVKSAILKGQTLVNRFDNKCYDLSNWSDTLYKIFYFDNLEVEKEYVFYAPFKGVHTGRDTAVQLKAGSRTLYQAYADSHETINVKFTLTEGERLHFDNYTIFGEAVKVDYPEILILESKYYYDGIPFFTGMKSVQMPVLTTVSKNLFNKELIVESWIDGSTGIDTGIEGCYVPIRVSGTIAISGYTGYNDQPTYVYEYDGNGKYIGRTRGSSEMILNLNKNTELVKIGFYNGTVKHINSLKIQVEKGTQATPYEPYKSNILTVNEEVELRGIGDVHDELNVVTGELTQRIGEIVLDGTQSSVNYSSEFSNNDYYCFIYDITKNGYEKATLTPIGISYYIPFQQNIMFPWTTAKEFALIDSSGNTLVVKLLKSRLSNDNSISTLNTYLASHPITINYPLMVESIKTVDLSTVNQDGDNTKLSTFNDITYVTLSSEGLIPEAELEVATKNEEVLNTMSLEMDDISTTQNALQETSDIQSENVDSTMIATTEIYEELL